MSGIKTVMPSNPYDAKGLMNAALQGTDPVVVTIGEQGITKKNLVVHDMYRESPVYAAMLAKMDYPDFPLPVGIFGAV